jgi:rod shape determining protein RodA
MSLLRIRPRRRRVVEDIAGFDRWLTFALVGLLVLGTLLVWASTRSWFALHGLDPQYYLKRHIINIVIGLVLGYAVTLIDYRILRAYTPILWVLGILGLLALALPGVGSTVNGARAWISLPGGFQIQPAELAKISVILGVALLLSESQQKDGQPSGKDVMKALGITSLPMIIIVLQPDLGTAIILGVAIVAMIAVSGAPTRWVVFLMLFAVIGTVGAIKSHAMSEYQLKRLQSFVNPSADPQQSGYQLRQSRITIGSGGVLGRGLFAGPQTNGRFVPEQQTDFIFTVAGEETGFLGSSTLILLFSLFFWRAFVIAQRTSDLFGRLVCVGVTGWLAFQTFENIGMTMGMMPMTGVPLPFVSYGGSSMFATLVGFGLLQSVHLRSR